MGSTINDKIVLSNRETYENLLANLECPFTWGMDYVGESFQTEDFSEEVENSKTLKNLLQSIMILYGKVKNGDNDANDIFVDLERCDSLLDTLMINRDDPEISLKVAKYVVQATKCFVYFKLEMQDELEQLVKNLENIENMNDKQKSTLSAFKSMCWSKFRICGRSKAEYFIREAIELNANCGLWHFILGKILRDQRRALSIADKPGDEEVNSFLKAYRTSNNPSFGVFVAEMYRGNRDYCKATLLYNKIYDGSFNSLATTTLLRLALGFISNYQLTKAKVCLDKAEKSQSKRSMYCHYRAKYHMKLKNYAEAARFFEEAIKEGNNLAAEKEYYQCMVTCSKSFDATKYLLNMLKSYEHLPEKHLQSLILDVAFSYWNREEDLKRAVEYFLKAIKIDPEACCLMNFSNSNVHSLKERNVYVVLEKSILPDIDKERKGLDQTTIENFQAIKEFCKVHKEA